MITDFCNCSDYNCPLHPRNHDKGCTPCIEKNLRQNEIPACFFKKINSDQSSRKDYSFKAFSEMILEDSVR